MKIIEIALVAFALFYLQGFVYRKLWDRHLKASVYFNKIGITEGEEGEVIEVIENRKFLPLIWLKVSFQTDKNLGFLDDLGSKTTDQYYRNDIFQVGGGEKVTRRLTFTGKKRGYYHIKNIDLMASDLFLLNRNVKKMNTESYLYVYPKCFTSERFALSLQKLNGEILVKRHLLEDPFEYRGVREYQPYDDIRSINWKATARTGELKVNQRNYTAMQTIRIFVNLWDAGILKHDKEIEASMQIAVGIASFFLSQGIKVSLYANGSDIITGEHLELTGGAASAQLEAIGKALARVDTEKEAKDFELLFRERILDSKDSFFTFFVSPSKQEDYVQLLHECKERNMSFCWYYPGMYYNMPSIPEGLEEHVEQIPLEQ